MHGSSPQGLSDYHIWEEGDPYPPQLQILPLETTHFLAGQDLREGGREEGREEGREGGREDERQEGKEEGKRQGGNKRMCVCACACVRVCMCACISTDRHW